MASDRDTLAEALGDAWDDGNASGLDGWIGPNRGAGEVDADAVFNRRREINRTLDGALAGWRPPAREITDPAEADALPMGSVALVPTGVTHTDVMPWTRSRSGWWAGGSVCTSEYLIRWRGPLTLIHVPTEDPDCPHDSRSGADGRWRCDQCGADCGPNTYLTPTEEGGRGE